MQNGKDSLHLRQWQLNNFVPIGKVETQYTNSYNIQQFVHVIIHQFYRSAKFEISSSENSNINVNKNKIISHLKHWAIKVDFTYSVLSS